MNLTPGQRTFLRDILSWARATGWHPRYPSNRRLGRYGWTNVPPGTPPSATWPWPGPALMQLTVDVDGHVELRQRVQAGWIQVGTVRTTSIGAAIDLLAALYVLPARFCTAYHEGYLAGQSEADLQHVLERALGDVQVRFWRCPQAEHRGSFGELREEVRWEGEIAHCTWPGCRHTSAER